MKRIILSIVMLAATLPALAWQQRAPQTGAACGANLVYGLPAVTKPDATLICRQGYVTLHDNQAKVPVWTAWVLTPNHINGCVPRSNAFAADQSLPAGKRSDPRDYAGTGYDQGHIANDAHQSWDQQVELESFLMSNMAPQLPGLNRGAYKLLEWLQALGVLAHSIRYKYMPDLFITFRKIKRLVLIRWMCPMAFTKLSLIHKQVPH